MWKLRKKKPIEEEETELSPLDEHFQQTLERLKDMDSLREDYKQFYKDVRSAAKQFTFDIDDESTTEHRPSRCEDRRDQLWISYYDSENQMYQQLGIDEMTMSHFRRWPLNLLKRSFIKWAEEEFALGYGGLVNG